ncbi:MULTISPECIES: RagB/SusD family nutrient uptake outer membrane protein [unclassified Algibacter]|uniref:RagB/SusD family nutrient uptake outer membrane protein n=1 Tax=unclassified Algibacter TaxID=2615009 RepID=UPI00131C9F5D|nr:MULTISPECIES: RagB/SusD family nutrient uptake outer membrane protein [unclassified Algibacter]MCL5128996.1 RagB/SusD family nutrient uptake outer membrane protein [Algibacter sp. L4_22]
MRNIKYNIGVVFVTLLMVTSCSDILDESPDNRTTINSAEKISELLVGAYPEGAYVPFLEPMSDNAGDKGPSADTGIDFATTLNERMFFWDDVNNTDIDSPTNYWNSAYKAIAQANQALLSIEELGGGAELNYLKGEALVCRAYAHYMLVNIFSKAYDPTTAASSIGIPYVTEPENVLLGEYERGTVESVYDNIKKDLEEGLPLIEDNYTISAYHFTTKAASAFASRFYLQIGEWEKVITQSTIAIGSGGVGALRDWPNNYRPATYSEQTALYTSSNFEPANLLLVSAESLYNRYHFSARYQLNSDKRDEVFPGTNGTGQPWSYSVFGSGDLFYNIPKFQEYFKVINQAAGTGDTYVAYVLLSTDEALLNRAEAYAMLGNLEKATEDINMSYSVKTAGYLADFDELSVDNVQERFEVTDADLFTPFYTIPTDALAFVNCVLSIKRTVFYNEGLRWFDIKRLNMVVDHEDIFGNVYTLPKGDNRRVVQIPEAAQSFGIQQNPR